MKEHALTFLRLQLRSRTLIAEIMIVLAWSRLGLYAHHTPTHWISQLVYGVAMFLMANALLLTSGYKARKLSGIIHASISAGLLAMFAFDVWLTAGSLNTSVMILLLLSGVLCIEAIITHEC